MSFRARLALVAAAAVGLAVVVASAVVFVVVRDQLRSQADATLQSRADEIRHAPIRPEIGPNGTAYLDVPPFISAVHIEVVNANGSVLRPFGQRGSLPVTKRILGAARQGTNPFFSDAKVDGQDFRVYTLSGAGFALEVARDMGEVNRTLHRIKLFLILIAAGGIGIAAALGLVVCARGAQAGPSADRDHGARHRDGRSLPTHRGDQRGRARPARHQLQHHACRARGLEPGPAAARRRCLARAAHAADEPADEHRSPRTRERAAAGGA